MKTFLALALTAAFSLSLSCPKNDLSPTGRISDAELASMLEKSDLVLSGTVISKRFGVPGSDPDEASLVVLLFEPTRAYKPYDREFFGSVIVQYLEGGVAANLAPHLEEGESAIFLLRYEENSFYWLDQKKYVLPLADSTRVKKLLEN